jgi:hypothetical protein
MKILILWLLITGIIHAEATEAESSTGNQNASQSIATDKTIHAAERKFSAELQAADLSPEARAIRVDQWRQDQAPLLKQAREARAVQNRLSDPISTQSQNTPELNDKEIPKDPILGEIHEIEKGIRVFQKSLRTQNLTPEQRALQVEQFHQINREALEYLATVKRQAAAMPQAEGESAVTLAKDAKDATPIPSEMAPLRAEIDRIMHDLLQVDPETRAKYIETHAPTLKAMGKELLRSATSSTNFPDQSNSSDEP